jgi:hypothetical protein
LAVVAFIEFEGNPPYPSTVSQLDRWSEQSSFRKTHYIDPTNHEMI